MTRLTPEREQEIREWARRPAVVGLIAYGGELVAELDAVRAERDAALRERDEAKRERDLLAAQDVRNEEIEAAFCPEDVGLLEYAHALKRQRDAALRERDDLQVTFDRLTDPGGNSLPDYWTAEKQLPFVIEALRKAEGRGLECPKCFYATNRIGEQTCANDGTRLVMVTWKDRAMSAVAKFAETKAQLNAALRVVERIRAWAQLNAFSPFGEQVLALLPATPEEPKVTRVEPHWTDCRNCSTASHCQHHQRCLAECLPADLVPATTRWLPVKSVGPMPR
jgi:hypothetical protein